MTESILEKKTFDFAIEIVKLSQALNAVGDFSMTKLITRAGTRVGALVVRALSADDQAEFIRTLARALKEAQHTHYWLTVCRDSKLAALEYESIIEQAAAIVHLLQASVKAARSRIITLENIGVVNEN